MKTPKSNQSSYIGENFLLYLLSKDFFSLEKFSSILSKEIKIKNIFRYSEEILNLIIWIHLLQIQDIKILSIDAIYYEYILGYKITFHLWYNVYFSKYIIYYWN